MVRLCYDTHPQDVNRRQGFVEISKLRGGFQEGGMAVVQVEGDTHVDVRRGGPHVAECVGH